MKPSETRESKMTMKMSAAELYRQVNHYANDLDGDLGRKIGRRVAADMAAEWEDYETPTALAEGMAAAYDLYTGDEIPEAVFELADLFFPEELI